MDQSEAPNLLEFQKVKNSDGSETVHYAAFWEGMPDECKTFAERELGETQEKVSMGIKYLKKFLKDKGLAQTDDVYLLAVLRNCKYDLEKSRVKLEKFMRARERIVEKVAEMDPEKVNAILNDVPFALLPYRDKHRRLIVMTKPTFSLDVYSFNDGFTCFLALILYILACPMTSLYGVAYIGENKAPSVSIFYQTLMAYKTWLKTLFDLPLPLRKIELTNENFVLRWFLNIIRHVIPGKVYKRISVHGANLENLKKAYHPDLLPEELEGNLGPLSAKVFRERLLDFMRKLKEEHRAKTTAEN